jgi:hypothetical protein
MKVKKRRKPRPDLSARNRLRWTPEARAAFAEKNRGNKYALGFKNAKGNKKTPEGFARIIAALIGNKHRVGKAPVNKGKSHTEATRALMRRAWTPKRRATASARMSALNLASNKSRPEGSTK